MMRSSFLIANLLFVSTVCAQNKAQPYLVRVTDSSVRIHWRSGDSVLQFWYAGGGYKTAAGNGQSGVLLTQLQPLQRYRYSIGNAPVQGFKTPPAKGNAAKLQFFALGDCGSGTPEQAKVRNALLSYRDTSAFNAVLLLGDNAYPHGLEEEYQRHFFDVYADSLLGRMPLYPSPGNHDYMKAKRARRKHNTAYFNIFPSPQNIPYYSVDIGNVHLVSLDSYGKDRDGSRLRDTTGIQAQWLKKDLEAYSRSGQQWLIFIWHHPPYSMGTYNTDKEGELRLLRKRLLPIIERYGADVVLNGHSHVYERSHLISGHYGRQEHFDSALHVQAMPQGSTYVKKDKGTLYVVAGSAGWRGSRQAAFPHKAMATGNHQKAGAVVLEVEGLQLRLRWIDEDGRVADEVVLRKE